MTKKYIETIIESLSADFFHDSVENIISKLERFSINYPDFCNFRITENIYHDYDVIGSIVETDSQYKKRLEREEKRRLKRIEAAKQVKLSKQKKEKEIYLKLKEKYENNI